MLQACFVSVACCRVVSIVLVVFVLMLQAEGLKSTILLMSTKTGCAATHTKGVVPLKNTVLKKQCPLTRTLPFGIGGFLYSRFGRTNLQWQAMSLSHGALASQRFLLQGTRHAWTSAMCQDMAVQPLDWKPTRPRSTPRSTGFQRRGARFQSVLSTTALARGFAGSDLLPHAYLASSSSRWRCQSGARSDVVSCRA